MARMWLQCVLALLTILVPHTYSESQNAINQQCNDVSSGRERCYSLYSDAKQLVTWDTASERCSAVNKKLAVIEEKSDWDTVQNVIRGANIMTGHGVWLAGRRSGDNDWDYLQVKNHEMLDGSYPSSRYCGRVSKHGIQSEICTVRHYAVCQYQRDSSGSSELTEGCQISRSSEYGEVCLSLVRQYMTWFEARNYCKDKYQDGDLASVHPVSMSSFDESGTTVSPAWIGLQRRKWMWTSANGETPIDHYYFGQGQGSDEEQSCLFLKQSESGATYWADQSCDNGAKYYLCQSETDSLVWDLDKSVESDEQETPRTTSTVYIAVSMSVLGVASISAVLIFLYVRRRQMIRAKRNEDRARSIREMTDLSQNGSAPERPQISNPMPMDVSYRVSGFANLGPLIPVTPDTNGPDPEHTYAEIPGERPRSLVVGNLPGLNMFGGFNSCAMTVNFAESDKAAQNGNNSSQIEDGNTSQGGDGNTSLKIEDYGNISTVNHVITDNGDEYALPSKTTNDIENVIVDNETYHSK